MENLNRSDERLENVQTVEPIVAALRTISLGGWRATLKRKQHVENLLDDLARIATALPLAANTHKRAEQPPATDTHDVALLIVGSERGLCGRFNEDLVDRYEAYLNEQKALGVSIELTAIGSRVGRILQRRGMTLARTIPLSGTAVPAFDMCFGVVRQWLKRYAAGSLQDAHVFHNQEQSGTEHTSVLLRIIPPPWPAAERNMAEDRWPPPIVETDPLRLFTQIVEQSTALRLYQAVLESRAAEHLARYQLTEAASQNIERLIEELETLNQMEARQKITREMQELAVASGLLKPSSENI